MKKTKLINWIIITGICIFSIFYLFFGNHEHELYKNLIIISIIPIILLPYFLRKILKININSQIEFIYLIFIFFAYLLGSILNFYGKIQVYDKIMHLLSGVMSAFLVVILLVKSKYYNKNKLLMTILFIICITLSIGVLWEFFEFISDIIFNKDAQKVFKTGVDDTMLDMIMAFIGSIIFSIIYTIEIKTNKKIFITKFIDIID